MLSIVTYSFAQTGIGTSTPHASAKLDVSSTDKGFLPPRMTAAQRMAITVPAPGLIVFQTNGTAGLYYFNGSSWDVLSNANYGDVKTGFQTADHNGWVKLDGRLKSSLTASQQTQATNLGFAANLPNATDAYLVQKAGTLGSVTGSNTKTIVSANLPNVALSGTTVESGSHDHTIKVNSGTSIYVSGGSVSAMQEANNNWTTGNSYSANVLNSSGSHTHSFSTSSINGNVTQTAFDVTPKSLNVNTFIYLGL